ncbi:MAG: hypothetical protein J7J03_02025 [Methanosarcinales archaeon]|nr:hypothetical protein [Methanosarcinales archaeon]
MLAIRELTGNVRRLRVGLAADAMWVVDGGGGELPPGLSGARGFAGARVVGRWLSVGVLGRC